MLLRLEGVSRSFGGRELFRDVAMAVNPGDRIGLVGPNGAGKTTLLRIMAGDEEADTGRVATPSGVRVGLLRQEVDPASDRIVFDEVASALSALERLEWELQQLEREMGECRDGVSDDLADRYDRARAAFEFGGGFDREARVERVLEGLGFDAEARRRPMNTFSGGWVMRVALAKLLLAAPDVLLLDEPTNHLDLPSIQWFEETLLSYGGAAVIVSHDRTFLRRHVSRVAELEGARFTVSNGSWDEYVRLKAERRSQLLAARRNQERQIAQTERFIERFRSKASKARQVQSRVKALERMERVQVEPESRAAMRLRIPEPRRSGDVVLRLDGIHKAYGDRSVYRGVDLELRRGNRIALAGPNGAGKSTLLRVAAGVLPIDAGECVLGHNVDVGFYAQHQLEVLDPSRSVLEEIEAVASSDDVPRLRGHLGAFLFSGDDVDKKVSVLSGGEKARLALARLLLRPSNFLVLDEPTNHLDVAACEVLEEALRGYVGTLLFISHDRAFINALATRVVEVRGGVLSEFSGNYDDYLRATGSSAAPASDAPGPTGGEDKHERMARRAGEKRRARDLARSRKRLAVVEEQISSLESRLEELSWKLGDPELHRDPETARALEAQRQDTRAGVDGLYREWEGLAAELEEAEELTG